MLVFLIGFMGSGKTTTGEKLARKLNFSFVDLDKQIESNNKKSISDIFEEDGEDYFRELEKQSLHECFLLKNTIISCGGGTPCFFDNMMQMKIAGITIYLKLAPGSLFHRLAPGKANRPLVATLPYLQLMEYIIKDLNKRESYYNEADIVIKGENLKTDELATMISKYNKNKLSG